MTYYPAVSAENAEAVAEILRSRGPREAETVDVPEENYVERKECPAFDLDALRTAAYDIHRRWLEHFDASSTSRENLSKYLEVRLSKYFYEAIVKAPLDAREDPAFWRWLALFPFRWYLLEREVNIKPQDYGGTVPATETRVEDSDEESEAQPDDLESVSGFTVDRRKPVYDRFKQLIHRTYLIGKVVTAAEPDDLSGLLRPGQPVIDVWHSHVIRIRNGLTPVYPCTFVPFVAGRKANEILGDARELAKRVTRMKNNVLLDEYSPADFRVILGAEMEEIDRTDV
jgi:hypothetical protein